jgi:hypothetical protein
MEFNQPLDLTIYKYLVYNKNLEKDFISQEYIPLLKKINNYLYLNEDNKKYWLLINKIKIDNNSSLVVFKEK